MHEEFLQAFLTDADSAVPNVDFKIGVEPFEVIAVWNLVKVDLFTVG